MYIKMTKTLMRKMPKEYLIQLFRKANKFSDLSKEGLILKLSSEYFDHPKLGQLNLYLSLCEYCRNSGILGIPEKVQKEPKYCVNCGKTSPNRTFQRNLERTDLLLSLSSNMRKKDEKAAKEILLEQAIVTLITSLEVSLKDVYSLIIDYKHVVYGESIYPRVYSDAKNDFLNLGLANSKLKKDTGLDLKNSLGKENYSYLSKMYSARHIIVHNCSIKDKDYINQTGETSEIQTTSYQ